jgi:hypothetical protein
MYVPGEDAHQRFTKLLLLCHHIISHSKHQSSCCCFLLLGWQEWNKSYACARRGCTPAIYQASCCCCTINSKTASSAVLVVVSYCWVGRSRINLMHVPGEDAHQRFTKLLLLCHHIISHSKHQSSCCFVLLG